TEGRSRMSITRVALLVVLAGCPKQQASSTGPQPESEITVDRDQQIAILAELKSVILTSYERDEPPEIGSSMIAPQVGTIRIGVGPGDGLVNQELERAPSRWPLDVTAATPTEARSK